MNCQPCQLSRKAAETWSAAMTLWRPPPKLTVSQWADLKRRLSAEASRWNMQNAAGYRASADAKSDATVHTNMIIGTFRAGWRFAT